MGAATTLLLRRRTLIAMPQCLQFFLGCTLYLNDIRSYLLKEMKENLRALQDNTISQESDVLINLDTIKCRTVPPGTSSARVALNSDESDMKELAAEKTSKGSKARHIEGALTDHDDDITETVTDKHCRQNQNDAKRKEIGTGCDPVTQNRPQVERHSTTADVRNVSQIKGDKNVADSNGDDGGMRRGPLTETGGGRVNIDEDITDDKNNEGHNGCHSDVDDGTEKKKLSDETNNCMKECQALEVTQDITTDDTVICCDSDTPEKDGSDTTKKDGCDAPEQCGSDTPGDGDKHDDTQDCFIVDDSHSSDTMDTDKDCGFREQGKCNRRKEGEDSEEEEGSESRKEGEMQGTCSPSLLEPLRKSSLVGERTTALTHRRDSGKERPISRPDKPAEDRSTGRHLIPSHLPLSASSAQYSVDSTGHKPHAKAIKRHEQEMTVLNKVETQLARAECALKQGDNSVNETVSKTLAILRPLLGQLTRSQKQERDRIERELNTSDATKLKKVYTVELVGQTHLLHKRQRRLVTLVQQHRQLVAKIGSSAMRKDQPMKSHGDSQCDSLVSFPTREGNEDDDARQKLITSAERILLNTSQDGTTDTTTMATKNKDPPDGSNSKAKKQKTSSTFKVPIKDIATVPDPGNSGNTTTHADGTSLNSELQGISEDSEMCGRINLSRISPQCLPLKLVSQSQTETGKMAQNSSDVSSSNANPQPSIIIISAANTAPSVCQPLVTMLTSTSAATSRQMTAPYISRPDGSSRRTLIPAAVASCSSWNTQPASTGSSCNSATINRIVAPPSMPNKGHFRPRHVSNQQTLATIASNQVPSTVRYPSLKMLIEIGLVSPGRNVLSIQTANKVFHGSLLPNGSIEGAGGVVYKTPTWWCKAMLGSEISPNSIKKKHAYRRVLHDDKPLARFRLVTKTTSDTCDEGHVLNNGETKLECAPGVGKKTTTRNLCTLMGKCYVTLINDAELFPSHSFLPSNFWDAPGFKGVDLPRELIDSIGCW